MGQIRLFLRSAPKIRSEDCAKKADSNTASGFHLLFDILAIGALCLSETETLLSQDIASLTSSGWRNRLESLPLRYAPWMHCTVQDSIVLFWHLEKIKQIFKTNQKTFKHSLFCHLRLFFLKKKYRTWFWTYNRLNLWVFFYQTKALH